MTQSTNGLIDWRPTHHDHLQSTAAYSHRVNENVYDNIYETLSIIMRPPRRPHYVLHHVRLPLCPSVK